MKKIAAALLLMGSIVGIAAVGAEAAPKCPAGEVPSKIACVKCPAGRYAPAGAVSCNACPVDTYSAAGAYACTACAPGTTTLRAVGAIQCVGSQSKASAKCSPGAAPDASGNCVSCNPGMFSSSGAASCVQCPSGSVARAAAADHCDLCNAGTFASSPGMMTCLLCAPGTFSNTPGSVACVACPSGTTSAAGALACN